METLASWFGLKEGHKDFFIANDVDGKLLFARQELDTQLHAILRKAFRTGNPPKMVLYGDWGVGKTHTMHHISYVVQSTEGYNARIVFIELGDINGRSTFQVAHAALLDALGMSVVKNWMIQFQTKHQSDSLPLIQKATQSEDIAKAFLNLPTYGDAARISWDWLRGEVLNGTDAKNAGLAGALEQSNHFVAVLRTLGRLCAEIDDNTLILMLDEANKLEDVTLGDAIHHWMNAFKILSDDLTKELGCIVAASFRDPDDMPQMLSSAQVMSRFGPKHYILLQNFQVEESRTFLRLLLAEWIDSEKCASLLATFGAECEGEPISGDTFPFTEPAFDRFVDYVVRNGGISTPRDIQKSLDDIANHAIDDNRHIVSSTYLEALFAAA